MKNMLNNGKYYVRLEADIRCTWHQEAPIYRVYVNDELFTERTFIWTDCYLVESIQLQVDPGKYAVRIEMLPRFSCDFTAENLRVVKGPAVIKKGWLLKVSEDLI